MPEEKIHIKVCGMREADNIKDVVALGVDYIGFIFYKKSPRYLGDDTQMINTPAGIKRVGVFVDENRDAILRKAAEHNLEFIQLHGKESPQLCLELQSNELKVIKVFSVDDGFDFSFTNPYKDVSDFFLFDTKGKFYGGNAQRFNWHLLNNYDQEIPFFLSGGINPDNINEIEDLGGLNLHAVDLNSGVENSPAIKSVDKIISIQKILNSKF